jgi:hypothetical protein
MAIEAPLCKYKKTNFKIGIIALVVAAIVFGYDGYLSKYKWSYRYSFYEKNVINNGGVPTSTMSFNRKAPPIFLVGAILLAGYFWVVRSKKLIADEQALVFSEDEKINYDAIQSINKTNFDSKGYFVVTYKDEAGNERNRKISDRTYDNLKVVLDMLVSKIT